jgi:dTDP-glucose pyrophosphorylase
MIIDLTDTLLPPQASIREAIACIDRNKPHVVFVVEEGRRLVGSVTDGDVRRGLLRGIGLDQPLREVMNSSPLSARVNESPLTIRELMVAKGLRHIPIVDRDQAILGVETLETLLHTEGRPNWVFLMAGGFGTRLRPFTQVFPKPLLPVGSKALIETILESFISFGFRRFFISVHYKAEMIKTHFGDGSRWGVRIDYIQEDEPLGTAGALGLLPEVPELPLIMMNGDILTKVNFAHLLEFHEENKSSATMCVREYDLQVPYGTVELEGQRLRRMVEKPTYTFFVNAGIYVFSPEVVSQVKHGDRKDIPQLIEEVQAEGREVMAYPIHEYWLDIGRMDDFERAQADVTALFGGSGEPL